MSWNLRLGLFMQLLAFIALNLISLVGGTKAFGFVALTTSPDRMTSSWNAITAIVFSFVWLLGACMLNGFRNCGDDEGR